MFFIRILYSIILCLTFLTTISYSKDRYFVVISPGSCLSCVASSTVIEGIDKSHTIFEFVFPERFSDDLDYIIEEYKLHGYGQNHFHFSDSLFDKFYEVNVPPYFVLVRDSGASVDKILFSDTNRLESLFPRSTLNDTIVLENPVFHRTTADILSSNDGSLYIFNQLRKDRIGYVHTKTNKVQTIFLSDTIIKAIFAEVFLGDLSMYHFMSKVDIPQKNEFTAGFVAHDTLYAMSSHSFFAGVTPEGDSIVRNFPYMSMFVKGEYIRSMGFDYILPDSCSFVKHNFWIYDNKLYATVSKVLSLCIDTSNAEYFVAEFVNKGGRYKFNRFLEYELPNIYRDVGHGLVSCFFLDHYFLSNLSNQLFDLNDKSILNLNIPHTKSFPKSALKDNGEKVFINQANVVLKGGVFYSIIFDRQKKQFRHIALSLNNNKILSDTVIEHQFLFPVLDKTDPGYVWLPLDAKKVVRKKVVE